MGGENFMQSTEGHHVVPNACVIAIVPIAVAFLRP